MSSCERRVFGAEVIIHRTQFACSLYLLCTCIYWVTSSPSLSVLGCRNNLRSSVGQTDQFPQLHISISKCQTILWLPVHLSLPVRTLLLLTPPVTSCRISTVCAFHLTDKVFSWLHKFINIIHTIHSLLVIYTGYGRREWPGDSADDRYGGARHGQLRPEPGGMSEGPDLHTDSGTSVSMCARAGWYGWNYYYKIIVILGWFYTYKSVCYSQSTLLSLSRCLNSLFIWIYKYGVYIGVNDVNLKRNNT